MTVELSTVVASFLDDSNLGQAEYAKAYRMAIRGLKDLSWDVVGTTKKEELIFGANHTALLPLDCVKLLDFGVSDGHGGIASFDKVQELDFNEDVPKYRNYEAGLNSDLENRNIAGQSYRDNYFGYGSLGVGSYLTIGKYKVDETARTIYIDPRSKYDRFFIQYLSYQNENCEYVVDIRASEALVAYIRWKFSMTGTRNTLQVQNMNKMEYYREKTNAKLRIKNPILQQLNKTARQSVKMAVKS